MCTFSVADSSFVSLPRGDAPRTRRGEGVVAPETLKGGAEKTVEEEGEGRRRGRWYRLLRGQVAAGTRQLSRNICRYFPGCAREQQERTTDFSRRKAKGPSSGPADTNNNRQSSVARGSSFLFRIFSEHRVVAPSPSSHPIFFSFLLRLYLHGCIRFLYPPRARGTLQDFQF